MSRIYLKPLMILDYTRGRSRRPATASALTTRSGVNRTLRTLGCALALLVLLGGTGEAVLKSEAEIQLEFGVKMARKGSWREAAFRFDKAIQADPSRAGAYNNYAVALENLGEFDKARSMYEKALELDPENDRIQANFERFQAFYRSHRREVATGP